MSLTFTYHLAQTCLNAYTGYMSHTAITKLRRYEESTEKAAQYLNTAAEQLHKTRTTQAAGAVSVGSPRTLRNPLLTTNRFSSL